MVTLAIDAGTSALKILRHDPTTGTVALDRISHNGIDIDAWLNAVEGTIRQRGDGDQIDRIAITGQMHGLLTREGGVWGEPIPWTDQRGASILPDLQSRVDEGTLTRLGGPLASGFLGVSLAWIAQADPDRFRRIDRVSLPKDALIAALTGEHATDPTDAAGTGLYDVGIGDWSPAMLDAIAIPHAWLPRIIHSGSVAGQVSAGAARRIGVRAGIPVVMAGGDAAVGAAGGGAIHQGDALALLSSGAQLILPDTTFAPDAEGRWYTWPSAIPDHGAPYLRMATLLNAGNALSWAETTLATGNAFPARPTSLVALPHLIGERAPIGDAASRGAFLGLQESTTAGEMRRAMLEGVAYGLRQALDAMSANGKRPDRIRLGGGGAKHPDWPQILADVLGLPIESLADVDLTVLGAAMIAEERTGSIPGGNAIEPDPETAAAYAERYALYRDINAAIAPYNDRLSHVRRSEP